jgi:hypothetical protein
MYGKIQSCGDFPLLARVIFVTFLAYFFWGGVSSSLVHRILGRFSLDFFEGIMGEHHVPLCG